VFDYDGYGASIAVLEGNKGQSGWLNCALLTVRSVAEEQFILLAGRSDAGASLDGDWCRRLLRLSGIDAGEAGTQQVLEDEIQREVRLNLDGVEVRNGRYFDAEVCKLDRWSDDLKLGLERELKDLDLAIKDGRRQSAVAVSLADKLAAQREIKNLEQKRNRKRRDLYEEQDRIDVQRADLIAGIEKQLATTFEVQRLFQIRWTLR